MERIYAINEHANRLNWTLLTFFSAFLLQIFLHGALNFLGLSRSAAENKMSEALFRLNVWLQEKKRDLWEREKMPSVRQTQTMIFMLNNVARERVIGEVASAELAGLRVPLRKQPLVTSNVFRSRFVTYPRVSWFTRSQSLIQFNVVYERVSSVFCSLERLDMERERNVLKTQNGTKSRARHLSKKMHEASDKVVAGLELSGNRRLIKM